MYKHFIFAIVLSFLTFSCSVSNKTASAVETTSNTTTKLVASSKIDKVKLDNYFKALEENDKFMGSITMSHEGKIIYTNAIGMDDLSTKEASTSATKYRVGSISKMFTTAMIFQAMEANKLALEDTIDRYFPKVKNADKITIGNMLNHRSGIFSFTADETYLDWNTKPKTKAELIDMVNNYDSAFVPNSQAEYSNSNYVLLSFILEDIYQKTFAELVNEKIIEPLGLTNTYYGGKINTANNECHSYSYLGEWTIESETDMSIPTGAGAMVSNPTDLNKFIEGLFAKKLISQESLNQMTNIVDGYGMGCFEFPYNDKKAYGHTGGIDGFSSFVGHFPKENLSLSLCSNGANYNSNDIMLAALASFFGDDFEVPTFETVAISAEELEQYLGIYATDAMPLKLTFTTENNTLIAQATGQPALALETKGNHIFEMKLVGAVFTFLPEENAVVLAQGGGEFKFVRE